MKDSYFIHFTFDNGGNPYLFRGTEAECEQELKKWAQNYDIKETDRDKEGAFYVLTEKGPFIYHFSPDED